MKIVPRLLGTKLEDPIDGMANLQVEDVHGLMQDRTSSHLMEVWEIVMDLLCGSNINIFAVCL